MSSKLPLAFRNDSPLSIQHLPFDLTPGDGLASRLTRSVPWCSLRGGRCWCRLSSPCSRRSGAFAVAGTAAAVLLASPALRAMADALSGRDGGKPALSSNRKAGFVSRHVDEGVAFGVERDCRDRRPIAGLTAPALWVGLAGTLVKFLCRAVGRARSWPAWRCARGPRI